MALEQSAEENAEAARLAELHALDILDTASDARLDEITQLASDIFEVPIGLVTLIDTNRQWIKSRCGLDISETGRDVAFCSHAIEAGDVLVIPDTHQDERFADNPLVTGPPYIRFYTGGVIFGPNGHALGTLCLIDHVPRKFGPDSQRRLRRLARLVEMELTGRTDFANARTRPGDPDFHQSGIGLPGRRALRRRLRRMFDSDTVSELSFVGIHLTNLAELRAGAGMDISNRILAVFAERIRHALPHAAVFGHWDDDEFGVAVPTGVAGGSISELTGVIQSVVETRVEVDDNSYRLRAVLGVATSPDDGADAGTILNSLRLAMQAADRIPHAAGTPVASPDGASNLRHHLELGARLDRAIAEQAITVALQPRVRMTTGEIVGFEVLARWHDPELGRIPPGEFIPVAERRGSIVDLGHVVQRKSLALLGEWREAGIPLVPLAINLAAAELHDPQLPGRIRDAIRAVDIEPAYIELEVTESSLITDVEAAIRVLEDLRDIGVRFAIDDFGTGFSSFRYLRELELDVLKVDRSFITDITTNGNDAAIVQAITAMGHALGLEIVAEGVERRDQLAMLRSFGCDTIQGYLFSPPGPPEEMAGRLAGAHRFEEAFE